MSQVTPEVQAAYDRVVDALIRLEPLFVPGMKLTFLAEHPTNPQAHMLVTSSTNEDIRKALDTVRPVERGGR
jgi:hypothetical protein